MDDLRAVKLDWRVTRPLACFPPPPALSKRASVKCFQMPFAVDVGEGNTRTISASAWIRAWPAPWSTSWPSPPTPPTATGLDGEPVVHAKRRGVHLGKRQLPAQHPIPQYQ